MFGLDDHIANLSDGLTLGLVVVVAVLLGLRHATDPDHLAAVTTLIASKREKTAGLAARLGFAWGLGHATTLFAFGLPIVLFKSYLPERVQQAAETTIGFVIIGLAVWLLYRWRRGAFNAHLHAHEHDGTRHLHVHSHQAPRSHAHRHSVKARTPLQAYAIGLVHGMGGSGGVGVLLLAGIKNHAVAVVALALFAFFTAVSMALLSTGFGLTLASGRVRRSFNTLAPVLGCLSLAFGVWYALGALSVAPYYF
jgi:ABC-type nickel/cobalt efflux system permease component RcnA